MGNRTERSGHRRLAVSLGLSALALATLLVPVASAPAGASSGAESRAGYQVPLYAGPNTGTTSEVGASQASRSLAAANVAVTVVYHGFPTAAKNAFQAAVNIWKTKLSSGVAVKVDATYTDLGDPRILGSAGPSALFHNIGHGAKTNTWYPAALANKISGQDLNGAGPEISASFNSTFGNWYFGTTGPGPSSTYDFESVVLHELGHGFGFLSGIYKTGSQIRWDLTGDNVQPYIGGPFTVTSGNTPLTSFPNGSSQLALAAQSNNVFWNGNKAKQANGGNRPRIYAPNPFEPGSSLSHLDENTYPQGNANSLMTPALNQGERIVSPGAITVGILNDTGWTSAK